MSTGGDSFEVLGRVALTDEATALLNGINDKLSAMGENAAGPVAGNLSVLGVAFAVALGQVAVQAVNALVGEVEGLAGDLFQAGVQGQFLNTVLDNLTGGLGAGLISWANDFAEKTGIARDTMLSMTKSYMALGMALPDAQRMAETIGVIGQNAGLSGPQIQNFGMALTNAAEQGLTATRVVRMAAQDGIANFGSLAEAAVSSITGTSITSIAQVDEFIKHTKSAWPEIIGYLENTGAPALQSGADAVAGTWVEMVARMQASFSDLFTRIGQPIVDLLTAKLAPLFNTIQTFLKSGVMDKLAKQFMDWIQPVVNWVQPAIDGVQKFFDNLTMGMDLGVAIKDLVKALGLGPLVDWWSSTGQPTFDKIRDAIVNAFSWLSTHKDEIVAAITTIATISLAGFIAQLVTAALAAGPLTLAIYGLEAAVLVLGVPAGRKTVISQIGEDAFNALNPIQQFEAEMLSLAYAPYMLKVVMDKALWDIGTSITNWCGTTISSMLSWADSWFDIGANMAAGLVNGFMGAVGGVISTIVAEVKRIWQAAMDAIGSKSPSTLFAQVGESMMAGISSGVTGAVGGTANVVSQATHAMVGAAGGAGGVGGAGGAGGGGDDNSIQDNSRVVNLNVENFVMGGGMDLQLLMNALRMLQTA